MPPESITESGVDNQLTDFQRAARVAPLVQIQSVALTSLVLQSELPHDGSTPEGIQYTPELGDVDHEAIGDDRIAVLVSLTFEAFDEPDDDAAFHLAATFRVLYLLPGVNDHSPEDLQSFARLNGTFNVWPYWRALVQTMGNHVGLHNLTMPVFRPHELRDRDKLS